MDAESRRIVDVYSRRTNRAIYSAFSPGQTFMLHQVEDAMLRALSECGVSSLHDKQILEVGCGSGFWIRQLIQWGASPNLVAGIDLIDERLVEARRRTPTGVHLAVESATSLSFATASFDLVIQATVMTSILDESLQQSVADEMLRVLRPGGLILWYDFRYNNPSNPDVRGVSAKRIRELFRGAPMTLQSTVLLPPLARRVAPYSRLACNLLSMLPPLRSHYVAAVRPL